MMMCICQFQSLSLSFPLFPLGNQKFVFYTCKLNFCFINRFIYVVIQLLSLCDPMGYSMPSSLSFTISGSLLKLISIESLMPSNLDILCHPLLLLPLIFLSISVFSNELVHLDQEAKVLEPQF